ncbi:hypothetical protein P5U49_000204 [Neisseria gonorrhoeae]
MKNLKSRINRKLNIAGKSIRLDFILIGMAAGIATLVAGYNFFKSDNRNLNRYNLAMTRQDARAIAHDNAVPVKRFKNIRYSKNKVCQAYGSQSANRPTYFVCFVKNKKDGQWAYSEEFGYLPDRIKRM